MEIAVAIQDVAQLALLTDRHHATLMMPDEQQWLEVVERTVHRHYPDREVTRIYFGSEFCQYRIPTLEDVRVAYDEVTRAGYAFTFVTPYVPEDGLRQLQRVFDWLSTKDDVEVVVNDWGVCFEVHRHYPTLTIVLGRLMNKMIRDPRIAHLYNRHEAPERAKAIFMNSALETPYFKQFLLRMNVSRVEYDSFIQPVEEGREREGIPTSLYVGYGVSATGRSCIVGTLHKPKEEKFQGHIQCKQQCTRYVAKMDNTRQALGTLPVDVLQKGNTSFYKQTETLLEEGMQWAKDAAITRLIMSPKIPV